MPPQPLPPTLSDRPFRREGAEAAGLFTAVDVYRRPATVVERVRYHLVQRGGLTAKGGLITRGHKSTFEGPWKRGFVTSRCRRGAARLSYPAQRIAIQYEGGQHRLDRRQYEQDIVRDEIRADRGWVVLKFTAVGMYRRPATVVERVRHHPVARGGLPSWEIRGGSSRGRPAPRPAAGA